MAAQKMSSRWCLYVAGLKNMETIPAEKWREAWGGERTFLQMLRDSLRKSKDIEQIPQSGFQIGRWYWERQVENRLWRAMIVLVSNSGFILWALGTIRDFPPREVPNQFVVQFTSFSLYSPSHSADMDQFFLCRNLIGSFIPSTIGTVTPTLPILINHNWNCS